MSEWERENSFSPSQMEISSSSSHHFYTKKSANQFSKFKFYNSVFFNYPNTFNFRTRTSFHTLRKTSTFVSNKPPNQFSIKVYLINFRFFINLIFMKVWIINWLIIFYYFKNWLSYIANFVTQLLLLFRILDLDFVN